MKISRRDFTAGALVIATGCGRHQDDAAAAADGGTPPPPGGPGGPDAGTGTDGGTTTVPPQPLSPLWLHASQTGVFPYEATVYPLEGGVPNGQSIASPDDPKLSATILSRWPDGSASVVVLAGEASLTAGQPKKINLQTGAPAGSPLGADRVAKLLTDVSFDFGALGAASVTSFGSPERVWWANAQVVCCRYRAPIGSDATLEAVIDVHAFASDRALVEIVIENGKIDSSAASPAKPETKTYANATVKVNGAVVATVSSPAVDQTYPSGRGSGNYAGGHEAFRAWYCSTWIGGDPGVETTHDAAALQAHPLFFRCWRAAKNDYEADYTSDAYVPWSAGRLNVPGMPGTGDIEGLGPLTQWDTRYLQTGSKFARRAVLASALGALSCNIAYRDATTGLVPTHAQSNGHNQDQGTWPATKTEPSWEMAHHPAVGLMAFLCRPSPIFLEIAQRVASWNATALTSDGTFGFWAQVRGKAWGLRSLAHAIFLTPDAHPFKAPAKASLETNVDLIDSYRTSPKNVLGFVWFPAPSECGDFEPKNEGMQQPLWMHHWVMTSLHAAANAKLLDGAAQDKLVAVTDWAALQPVRYVNEAKAGEWRLHNYLTTVGRAVADPAMGADDLGSGVYAVPSFDALPTYPENFAWYYTDAPPPSSGKFLFIETNPGSNPNYRTWASGGESNTAGVSYAAIFWAALTVSVERNVPGAAEAWQKVTTGITNLDAWSESFADEPRYNRYPRNR